jgi:hypothetical protein
MGILSASSGTAETRNTVAFIQLRNRHQSQLEIWLGQRPLVRKVEQQRKYMAHHGKPMGHGPKQTIAAARS